MQHTGIVSSQCTSFKDFQIPIAVNKTQIALGSPKCNKKQVVMVNLSLNFARNIIVGKENDMLR